MKPNGWECPKCGRVWAPWVKECSDCNNLIGPYKGNGVGKQWEWEEGIKKPDFRSVSDKHCVSYGDVCTNSDQWAEYGRTLKEKRK